MGRPEIKVPLRTFVYGGDAEMLCRECQLPCTMDETSMDCFRRFFLGGLLECSYFVYGYCFLEEKGGCVFDNGGEHDTYWQNALNQYFHNVKDIDQQDPDFVTHAEELKKLIAMHIENRQVSLCRYLEEHYNRIMETGGGMNEEMLEKLDEAYYALLGGTSRKK